MSDQHVPHHLRDIDNPPSYLTEAQQQNWISAAKKAKKNYQRKQQYPPFIVPPQLYNVIYIHKQMTGQTMEMLIEHVQHCNEFTFDTESEKSNKKLALIQIQTIPDQLPSLVILLELAHLPPLESQLYTKIKHFFQLVFRSTNSLYSWGPLDKELLPAISYELFMWPIPAPIYDIQSHFNKWYAWALSHCEVCRLSIDTNVNTNAINYHTTAPSLSRPCHCYESSPYRINEKWSLQQAVIFIYKIFIDKNETFNHWAHGLDPIVSTLPEAKRLSMIRYAIYDCFATTLLARPIIEYWPFTKIENSGITELFQKARSPLSINPNITISNIYQKSHQKSKKHITTNLELISDDDDDNDDEIYLNQCRAPVRQALPTYEPISEDEITINQHHLSTCTTLPMYEPISDDEQPQIVSPDAPTQEINIQSESEMNIPPELPQPPTLISLHRSRHNRRTATARRHRNKKRNDTHRSHRYRYYVTRPVHHRFSMASIKVILERHNIRYTHIKIRNSSLIIGLQHHHMKHQAHQQLPYATFNRLQYYEHHRRSRESRHHHSHESRHHYFYESRHYHYHDSRYHRHRHHSRHTHYAT
ncbi:unnamed protein product [Rotaria socialis]|uniref:Uncharacterized protein n=1 Tax=Rotaria socialis TaxID=392032 RepID=A0A821QQ05_9BILA|nr:unnamed protein product [Rotaria socialis]CAF4830111.1 unnamed protein product [Rotaria socialis]